MKRNIILVALLSIVLMLSCSENSLNGSGDNPSHGSSSSIVPKDIIGRTLILYKGNDVYLSATHLTDETLVINDKESISYHPDSSPSYGYSRLGGNTAQYVMSCAKYYYWGTDIMYLPYLFDFVLTFESKNSGSFSGTVLDPNFLSKSENGTFILQ